MCSRGCGGGRGRVTRKKNAPPPEAMLGARGMVLVEYSGTDVYKFRAPSGALYKFSNKRRRGWMDKADATAIKLQDEAGNFSVVEDIP